MRPGTRFTTNDSTLALFDGNGTLLAFNDDAPVAGRGLQSSIVHFTIPATGTYYVGVAAYPNAPLPNHVGSVITGWRNDGEANFDFNLNVTRQGPQGGGPRQTPEPASAGLLGFAGLLVGGYRWRHRRQA